MPAAGISKLILLLSVLLSSSCSQQRYLSELSCGFLEDPAIAGTYTGISIYDPASGKHLYSHNCDKYFVPASNAKLPTLYAGLKFLEMGVPGIRYFEAEDTVYLLATGDPTFLVRYFEEQPVFNFLKDISKDLVFLEPSWETTSLGYGWPWNFYLNYYMAERSPFPVYGNVITWAQRNMRGLADDVHINYVLSDPGHPWPVEILGGNNERLEVRRPVNENIYTVYPGLAGEPEIPVPYVTGIMKASLELLSDTLKREVGMAVSGNRPLLLPVPGSYHTIYSRPADSLLRPMMLYSDNFFAEQVLIMVSQQLFGLMDERAVIEYLLSDLLKEMPRKPRWVDGSGLSRYNLFTPGSLVWLLAKMNDEFGFERMCRLLPTGGEGTLGEYFTGHTGRIFAKTGTLGGNSVALSGYLVTDNKRTLVFSILVNNHNSDTGEVRRAVERYLTDIIRRY